MRNMYHQCYLEIMFVSIASMYTTQTLARQPVENMFKAIGMYCLEMTSQINIL